MVQFLSTRCSVTLIHGSSRSFFRYIWYFATILWRSKVIDLFSLILNPLKASGFFYPQKASFTYLIPIRETLEKGVKYIQIQQQRHQNDVNGFVQVSLLLTLNMFRTFFQYFYSYFEQVNVFLGLQKKTSGTKWVKPISNEVTHKSEVYSEPWQTSEMERLRNELMAS